jgi:hypothetical protein
MRSRILYAKLLAPAFRDDPVVQQLVDFSVASSLFPGSLGESGFLPPERLSDPRLFQALGMPASLPSSFASAERDGYEFKYDGRDCNQPARIIRQLGTVCAGFVYGARPLDPSTGARSYALFSDDDRIHYRSDGEWPARTDPTVDNTAPSSAADLPGADLRLQEKNSKVTAALRKRMDAIYKAAGLGNAAGATIALHEQNATADLRQVAAAENVFLTITARGYAAPERLADAGSYADLRMPPLLPGYFVQPKRHGYLFTFVGEQAATAGGSDQSFGPLYQAYVYSAVPTEPGPAGRRAFVLYSDGQIYATTEKRVPTRRDSPISSAGR